LPETQREGTTMNAIRSTRRALPVMVGMGLTALVAGCVSSKPDDDGARRDPNVVEADDVRGRAIDRVERMLRGQVAGVEVRETPRGLSIRIRGGSSIYAGTEPLFVIDGLPLAFGEDGVLDGINAQDIASIRVLKNASETAAYGARGANGVVLITTKRGPTPADTTANRLRAG